MSIKSIGLRDAWRLPGTSELYSTFDVARFDGLEMSETAVGVKLQRGAAAALVPWSNVLGVDYLPAVPSVAKAK